MMSYYISNVLFRIRSSLLMCVCEAKRPAHVNPTGAIASDATCVCAHVCVCVNENVYVCMHVI